MVGEPRDSHPKTRRVACPAPGCGKHIELPTSRCNLGDQAKLTGWEPILSHIGSVLWLCPEHFAECQVLAKKLVELCGGDADAYLPEFVRERKRG